MITWISSFFAAFGGQAVAYFAVVGLVFLGVWRSGWFAGRRLVGRGRRFDGEQLRSELRHTLVVLALGTAQALVVQELFAAGRTQVVDGPGPWGAPGVALWLVGLILFNDLWFYGVHRALHTPWLFSRVHAVHHRSVDVNPFSSYSFHAVEALLLTGWIVPAALVVPIPMPALMVAQVAGLANNVMAHLGYELLPAWWVAAPVLRWSNSATFHSMHHTGYKGNFGLFTRLWDRLFGTELPGYEEAFMRAHRAAPADEA